MTRAAVAGLLVLLVLAGCRADGPGTSAPGPTGDSAPGPTGVEGTVTDGSGAPVAGATVARQPAEEPAGQETVVTAVVAVTGADGRWAWSLPAGTWQVTATAPGRRDARAQVRVREGERTRLDLVLPPR